MIEDAIQENRPMEAGFPLASRKARETGSLKPTIAFLLLCGLMTVGVVGAHRWKETLKLRRVLVGGSHILSPEEIVKASKVTAGTPIFAVNLNTVRENIDSMVYVKSVIIARDLPDILRIQVEEREPIAAIPQQPTIFVDDAGVALPPYPGNALFDVPLITGFGDPGDLKFGSVVQNAQVLQAISLLRQAKALDMELYHIISEVHPVSGGESILYSSDAGVPILLGKDDEAKKLLMLETFWKQFVHQRGAEKLRVVDLRFDDQVIARWKESPSPAARDGTPTRSGNRGLSLHSNKGNLYE